MNVKLRAPASEDCEVLSRWRNDRVIQRQLMIEPKAYSAKQVRAWICRRTKDSAGEFFVIDCVGPCGFVQLTRIDRQQGTADLGICLIAGVRGKGVAVNALERLESHAKRKLGCKRVTLRVLRINHRAIALYRKMKFKVHETKHRFHFDGDHWCNVVFMEKRLR